MTMRWTMGYDAFLPDFESDTNTIFAGLGAYLINGGVITSENTRFGYGYSMSWAGGNNDNDLTWVVNPDPMTDRVYFGTAVYIGEAAELDNCQFKFRNTAGAVAWSIRFGAFGTIYCYLGDFDSGGSLWFASPGGSFRLNTWFYFEIALKTHPTLGEFEMRVNTVPLCDYTNINTGSSSGWNAIRMGLKSISSKQFYLDDQYVCDSQGDVNNNFLGNVRCQGLLTTAPGDSTTWTSSDVMIPNWEAARNQEVNDDLYVYTDVVGDFDLYHIDPLVNSPEIFAVSVYGFYRQDDATQRFGVNVIKSGSTTVDGPSHALNQTYTGFRDIYEEDPDISGNWLPAAVNDLQIGPKAEDTL